MVKASLSSLRSTMLPRTAFSTSVTLSWPAASARRPAARGTCRLNSCARRDHQHQERSRTLPTRCRNTNDALRRPPASVAGSLVRRARAECGCPARAFGSCAECGGSDSCGRTGRGGATSTDCSSDGPGSAGVCGAARCCASTARVPGRPRRWRQADLRQVRAHASGPAGGRHAGTGTAGGPQRSTAPVLPRDAAHPARRAPRAPLRARAASAIGRRRASGQADGTSRGSTTRGAGGGGGAGGRPRAAECSAAAAERPRPVWACRPRSSCPTDPAPGARCPSTESCRGCARTRRARARPAPRGRRARALPSAAAEPDSISRAWPS